jgi:alpha-galactosidase/6-phospho-beta-glucosidase family protein
MKIAIVGAGSIGFTRGIVRDILSVPEFRDATEFAFTDISRRNLDMVAKLCGRDIKSNGVKSKLTATLDRRKAFKDADYVFCTVRVGGLKAFQLDIDIPLRYGVDQCVGDTLCAGGIMYAQRGIPVLLEFCRDIAEVAKPDCVLISHTNPMSMNTWACNEYGGVDVIGLCHGVEGGHNQIAQVLGLPRDEVDIICAGLNHRTWYVQVRHKGVDLTGKLLAAFEKHPDFSKTEKVRIDMLRRFGYYSTESNGHLSEYVPWYRKRPREIRKWISLDTWINGETGGYLRVCTENRAWFETDFPKWMKEEPWAFGPEHRGHEHGSYIIEGFETGRVYRGHFNVINGGCITNLPDDCCVEVPGYVDGNGLSIPTVGDLPTGCAGLLNQSVAVERLAVGAAITCDDEMLRQAMMLDPLTGAVCNPPEIWQMVDEMLVAQARWLPQYKRAVAAARRRLKKSKSNGTFIKTKTGYKGAARLHTKTVAEMRNARRK